MYTSPQRISHWGLPQWEILSGDVFIPTKKFPILGLYTPQCEFISGDVFIPIKNSGWLRHIPPRLLGMPYSAVVRDCCM